MRLNEYLRDIVAINPGLPSMPISAGIIRNCVPNPSEQIEKVNTYLESAHFDWEEISDIEAINLGFKGDTHTWLIHEPKAKVRALLTSWGFKPFFSDQFNYIFIKDDIKLSYFAHPHEGELCTIVQLGI